MTNSPKPTEPTNDPDAAITNATPTTAEEAMDADSNADGFVDESAYTPAKP